MKHKIIVVGNGFDIDLGLPTRYSDFVDSPIFEELIKSNELCQYLYETYKECNWVDIEISLKDYVEIAQDKDEYYTDYVELKDALFTYLSGINLKNINRESFAYNLIVKYAFEGFRTYKTNEITILNFNYTNSVNYIIDDYYFKTPSIINFMGTMPYFSKHIHGDIRKNNIILGVEDNDSIPSEYNFIKKSYDKSYRAYKILLLTCDELIVFGHSMGETDDSFFRPFFRRQLSGKASPKKISIYFKGDDGYLDLLDRLDNLTDFQLNTFREYNILDFIDIDNYKETFKKSLNETFTALGCVSDGLYEVQKAFKGTSVERIIKRLTFRDTNED